GSLTANLLEMSARRLPLTRRLRCASSSTSPRKRGEVSKPRTDMTDHYDALETRDPAAREADLFARLPDVLRKAMAAPAYAERLKGTDPAEVTSRAAL